MNFKINLISSKCQLQVESSRTISLSVIASILRSTLSEDMGHCSRIDCSKRRVETKVYGRHSQNTLASWVTTCYWRFLSWLFSKLFFYQFVSLYVQMFAITQKRIGKGIYIRGQQQGTLTFQTCKTRQNVNWCCFCKRSKHFPWQKEKIKQRNERVTFEEMNIITTKVMKHYEKLFGMGKLSSKISQRNKIWAKILDKELTISKNAGMTSNAGPKRRLWK